jgi:flagellar hook-basal body complex protein FliE
MANVTDASNAYLNTIKQVQGNVADKTPQPSAGDASFGDILKSSLDSAIDAQHKSEKTSADAIVGKAGMTDVLQAVNNAEMALKTVLAVRDRVVQAYQEVMRTSI